MPDAKLTPTMLACLEFARQHGNELVRSPGGFWSHRGWMEDAAGRRGPWFGASTVNALIARNAVEVTEWHGGRRGSSFPIAVRLK